jgi:hypothetical protein
VAVWGETLKITQWPGKKSEYIPLYKSVFSRWCFNWEKYIEFILIAFFVLWRVIVFIDQCTGIQDMRGCQYFRDLPSLKKSKYFLFCLKMVNVRRPSLYLRNMEIKKQGAKPWNKHGKL